ncbi:MAG: ThuA domain-containing protein [Deltaproteobacteria bacterium]|nr:ThuA domain-containing protein [Deltaproteobacteria bacterium]
MTRASLALAAALVLMPASAARAGDDAAISVLVLTRTTDFRHDAIPAAREALASLAAERDWQLTLTEEADAFTPDGLAVHDVVVFLLTSGDVLDGAQERALDDWVRAGGGFVGVHSAADTERSSTVYRELLGGALFASHPDVQRATVRTLDRDHPATAHLPARFARVDEWYDFDATPRGRSHVLLSVDESSYSGGTMGYDHPLAWCHGHGDGQVFYTALGHTLDAWADPAMLEHVAGAIEHAAGIRPGDCEATRDDAFEIVVLEPSTRQPMSLDVLPDGRVLFVERGGRVRLHDPALGLTSVAAELPVFSGHEDGVLGVALAPDFATTGHVFVYWSPDDSPVQRLSRFVLAGERLDLGTERIVLEVPVQREECCHSAGSIAFHPSGDLYVSTGNNTNPFASDGFSESDERPGRAHWDAQRTSANTDDLRGKILRIHPEPDGSYSIPAGNLFPEDGSAGRPEIYAMGFKNPFRIEIDAETGWLYVGDVGPDAQNDVASRGPRGYDELEQIRRPGNYGWPYCVGPNLAYRDYDFATGASGESFDCRNLVNDSPNNTGARVLPPGEIPLLSYPYDEIADLPVLGSGGRTVLAGPVYRTPVRDRDSTALPSYYEGTALVAEFSRNWIVAVHLDDEGGFLHVEPFLPRATFRRPIDLDVGPDGRLYMLEFGTEWGDNDEARLTRIDYAGGRHTPRAVASATPRNGPVPLEVRLDSTGTTDPDGDALALRWDLDGDGDVDAEGPTARHTYDVPGRYLARLEAEDPSGRVGRTSVEIVAGNSAPVVTIELPAEGDTFAWGERVPYRVRVEDAEDGSSDDCDVCARVTVTPAIGHDAHAHPTVPVSGCEGSFRAAEVDGHPARDGLVLVLDASYTDRGAPGSVPIVARASRTLRPGPAATPPTSRPRCAAEPVIRATGGGGCSVTSAEHASPTLLLLLLLVALRTRTSRFRRCGCTRRLRGSSSTSRGRSSAPRMGSRRCRCSTARSRSPAGSSGLRLR